MKKLFAVAVSYLALVGGSVGQWQVPTNTSPLGRGTGTGFKSTPLKTLLVTDYASCNGVADDTAGFGTLALAASAARHVRVVFPINATCMVWPTDASANLTRTLLQLDNLVNATLDFNGTRIHSLYTGNILTQALRFVNSSNVAINSYAHTSDRGKQDAGAGSQGVVHIELVNSHSFKINSDSVIGGQALLNCGRSFGSTTARSYDIEVNGTMQDVYYPFDLFNDCDDVRGTVHVVNAGRPGFFGNVTGFNISLFTKNQTSQTVIGGYGTSLASASAGDPPTSQTSGTLRIFDTTSTTCTADPLSIGWQQPSAGAIANIDVNISIEQDMTSCATPYNSIMVADSYMLSAGNQILGDAGHTGNIVLERVRVKGDTSSWFLNLGNSARGWGNNAKVKWTVRDVLALDMTHPILTGNFTGSNYAFDGVRAPSSVLTPDGAYPANTFAARNVRLSNISAYNGQTQSSLSIFEPGGSGSINWLDSASNPLGIAFADSNNFYMGTSSVHPWRWRTGNTDWIDLDTSGRIVPITNNTSSIGTTVFKFANVFSVLGTFDTITLTNALAATSGGIGQSTYATGDTIYASAANTLSKLAGNTTTNRKFYRQTGTGSASQPPAWDTLLAADVPGSALSSADDTNVKLALTGSPAVALLQPVTVTVSWVGQLSAARGGFGTNVSGNTGFPLFTAGVPSFITVIPVASGGTNASSASGTALDNITGFSSTGLLVRTGTGAYAFRTIGSGAGITVANGDGVAGAPSVGLSTARQTLPTFQAFTTGTSATYTTPPNALYIVVRLCGGGGGGAGGGSSGAGAGGNGGNTTFSTLTGNGGVGGATTSIAAGGTASGGDINVTGSGGSAGLQLPVGGGSSIAGMGGAGIFGGAGVGGTGGAGGSVGQICSGGGGGGASGGVQAGGGGAAGGYTEKLITSPAATYTYTVGAAGSAGAAGTSGNIGQVGGTGQIFVREFYN